MAKFVKGEQFFLYNGKYNHHHICIPSKEPWSVTLFDGQLLPDAMWTFEEEPKHPGFYYIVNVAHPDKRIAKYNEGFSSIGAYSEDHFPDQLWRFQKEGDYYRIFNFQYSNHKLVKFTQENNALCSYDGGNFDDQLWKIVPRFEAKFVRNVLWECDNRKSSTPFSERVKFTKGLTLSNSSTVSTKAGFKLSLKASLGFGSFSAEATSEFYGEIDKVNTSGKEETWSEEREITFTAPAGTLYTVFQSSFSFASPLSSDGCILKGQYIVNEGKNRSEEKQ